MKGQYRIILEIVLVMIGIIMTGFVISVFSDIKEASTGIATEDGMNAVANEIVMALLEASLNNNSVVRVEVPDRISGSAYRIVLDTDGLTVSIFDNPSLSVRKNIFNITSRNRIIRSEVLSSAKLIEIVNEKVDGANNQLRIRRGIYG